MYIVGRECRVVEYMEYFECVLHRKCKVKKVQCVERIECAECAECT